MRYTYTSAEVREHFKEDKAETALELSKWGDGSTAAVGRSAYAKRQCAVR